MSQSDFKAINNAILYWENTPRLDLFNIIFSDLDKIYIDIKLNELSSFEQFWFGITDDRKKRFITLANNKYGS